MSRKIKNSKKGDIVLTFLVLLLVAGAMIYYVSSFTGSIWGVFFPSPDKATIKSFETIYTLINSKSYSGKQYDSGIMNIYLKDGYRIFLFGPDGLQCGAQQTSSVDNQGNIITNSASVKLPLPKECTAGKNCLCLYKDQPLKEDIEKYLIECKPFDILFSIDTNYLQFNNKDCSAVKNQQQYSSYIVAHKEIADKKYIYIMQLNDANRALDANWKIFQCKTTNTNDICYGKQDGDLVLYTDTTKLNQLYDFCKTQNPNYKSISARCTYDTDLKDCKPDCSVGDTYKDCQNMYHKCSDYNTIPGIMPFIKDNSPEYQLCINDAKYCNIGNCGAQDVSIYGCKQSSSGQVNDNSLATNGCILPENCNPQYSNVQGTYGTFQYLASYDYTDSSCQKSFSDNFYTQKTNIYACNIEDSVTYSACKQYVDTNANQCELKTIVRDSWVWITHYNPSCQSDIDKLFVKVRFCGQVVQTPQTP